MNHLAIIIINFNNLKNTLECLGSVDKLNWSGLKTIIVVDNHSKIDPKPEISKQFPRVTIINSPKNLGFAEANNAGVKLAKKLSANLVMLLNNDTKVDSNLAKHLYQTLKDTSSSIAVPKIYFYPGYEFHRNHYKANQRGKVIWYAGGHIDWQNIYGIHEGVDKVDTGQFNKSKKIEFATGCCMMIDLKLLKKIKLFDQRYFLYLEDADFSVRAKKFGATICYQPKAFLYHKNAESTGGSGSSLQDYYFTRNRLLFGFRFASLRTKLALFRESLRFLVSGSKWKKFGVLDFYLHRFGRGRYPLGIKSIRN